MAISPCITLSTSVAQTLWGWFVGTEPWSGCIARESMRKYPNNKFQIFEYQKYEMSYNIIESTHKYRNTNFKQCFKCQTKTKVPQRTTYLVFENMFSKLETAILENCCMQCDSEFGFATCNYVPWNKGGHLDVLLWPVLATRSGQDKHRHKHKNKHKHKDKHKHKHKNKHKHKHKHKQGGGGRAH